jgi:hypothetical protein
MIMDDELELKRDELETLQKDVSELDVHIASAADDGDADSVQSLTRKKKGLIAYISDLTKELEDMSKEYKGIAEDDSGEEKTENQAGSFGHSLLSSTILEGEEGVSGEGGEVDRVQGEERPDWDGSPDNETGVYIPPAEEEFEDWKGSE